MDKKKIQTLVLLIIVGMAIVPTAAYIINNLQSKEELWVSDTVESEFNIDKIKFTAQGKNKMRVKIDYTNEDSSDSHSANVTITLIDTSGDVISIGGVDQVDSVLTGVIDADASDKINVVFTATDIVSITDDVMVQFSDLT